jgi:DNA processing protein
VEAAERSGSLITARFALEQGREVFAVPGVAQSMRSKGTHRLLRQGAKLVESVEDVLEEIRPLIRPAHLASGETNPVMLPKVEKSGSPDPGSASGAGPLPQGSPEETLLLRILDKVPKHIDEVAQEANLPVQRAAAMLLELELKGLVTQLPGKYFISGM